MQSYQWNKLYNLLLWEHIITLHRASHSGVTSDYDLTYGREKKLPSSREVVVNAPAPFFSLHMVIA